MTTNYPERLDEALVRPGRIDMKVNFGKCTNNCLFEMYEHFFEDIRNVELWPENFDKSSLPTDRWTPAEAAQILLGNTHNPHQALEHFVKEYPKSKFETQDNKTMNTNNQEKENMNLSLDESPLSASDKLDGEDSSSDDLNSDESHDSSVSLL